MNRNDLVFVGIRLLGLYLLIQSAVGLLGTLRIVMSMPEAAGLGWILLSSIAGVAIGGAMFLHAPRVEAWLAERDRP